MFQCSDVPEHFENRGGGQIILFFDMNYYDEIFNFAVNINVCYLLV